VNTNIDKGLVVTGAAIDVIYSVFLKHLALLFQQLSFATTLRQFICGSDCAKL